MEPRLDPFVTLLDLQRGTLDPQRADPEPRYGRDLVGFFQTDPIDPEALIYQVRPIPVPKEQSEIQCSTTTIEPGTVDGEYHMTKGHFHVVRERSEIYLGLAGEGLLVEATEDGRHHTEPMSRGSLHYIPGGWAHRTVNVGAEPLTFLAAYIGDAGQDYDTILRDGFPVVVRRGENGPEVSQNPRHPRVGADT